MRSTNTTPIHIAIIPDGNRRWAKQKNLMPWQGHDQGIIRFREISETIHKLKIPYFTFWGASIGNLTNRSKFEVAHLVTLLKKELLRELHSEELEQKQVQIRVTGFWKDYIDDHELNEIVIALENKTKNYTTGTKTLLFGYDGTRDMLEAIKKIKTNDNEITTEAVHQNLCTHYMPPVDFIIRTGGEPHWSAGFLMWHATDSQLYFTEKFWPEFDDQEFELALSEYAQRERRFGK